jgi:predicted nucleotidyltransferase component of viral defense system
MAYRDLYQSQVALLMRVLPLVAEEEEFALKGGTAINLFYRDMPRLSVDIDLTFVPIMGWDDSLAAIDAALGRISARITQTIPGVRVTPVRMRATEIALKLLVDASGVQIKIEVTPVLRGCAYPPELKAVSAAVEAMFGFAETHVVSFADLYAGKIVAALDRQHPRDLFDVRELLANEGVTDEVRCAFIVYLLGHGRPMAEVLSPHRKNLVAEYERGFVGMTTEPIALDTLVEVRETIIAEMVGRMPGDHRRFLLSFEKGEPDWSLLGMLHVAELPAVRWRQQNLDKLSRERRNELVAQLTEALGEATES